MFKKKLNPQSAKKQSLPGRPLEAAFWLRKLGEFERAAAAAALLELASMPPGLLLAEDDSVAEAAMVEAALANRLFRVSDSSITSWYFRIILHRYKNMKTPCF